MDLIDRIEEVTCELERLEYELRNDTELTTADWFSVNYHVGEVFGTAEDLMGQFDEGARRALREAYRVLLDIERMTEDRAFASLDVLSGVTRG